MNPRQASKEFTVKAFTALFAFWLACGVPGHAQVEDLDLPSLEKVQRHLSAREFNRALKTSDDLVRMSDGLERARALNARGWTLFEKGDGRAAQTAFEAALAIAREIGDDTLTVRILNNMGINLFVSGDLARAGSFFLEARDLGSELSATYLPIIESQQRSEEIRSYINKGIGHRLNREFDEAIEQYSRALALEPANIDALSYRGYAYFRQGDHAAALRDIQDALDLDPERLDAIINFIKTTCNMQDPARLQRFLDANAAIISAAAESIENDYELGTVCSTYQAPLAAVDIRLQSGKTSKGD